MAVDPAAWSDADTVSDHRSRVRVIPPDLLLSRTPTARIQEMIARLRDLNHGGVTLDDTYPVAAELLRRYPTVSFRLTIRGGGVWRARKSQAGQLFTNVRQLWYPHPNKVTKPGRLNAPGQTVFYCSPRRHIAGLEVRPGVDEWVTVLAAGMKNPEEKFELIPLGLERCQKPVLDYLEYVPIRDLPFFRKKIGSNTNYKKWCMIDDSIADMLSTEVEDGQEHLHLRTIAVAMVFGNLPIDGFAYPSIATKRAGINFCLFHGAADGCLKPDACHVFKLQPGDGGVELFKALPIYTSSSIDADGTINWTLAKISDAPPRPWPWWDLRRSGLYLHE
jgi:hypothetical protein